MSKTIAFSALGGAIGPTMAGYLASLSISMPFFISGLLVLASALPLFRISTESNVTQ